MGKATNPYCAIPRLIVGIPISIDCSESVSHETHLSRPSTLRHVSPEHFPKLFHELREGIGCPDSQVRALAMPTSMSPLGVSSEPVAAGP